MVKKAINIDHSQQSINVEGNGCLILNENGSVLLGGAITLPDTHNESISLSDYEGALRFNEETKKLEYCDGNKWIELLTNDIDSKESTIFSLLF